MKLLAFDTSSKLVSIAVFQKDKVIASFDGEHQLQEQSKVLLPEIENLLSSINWKPEEIDAIAVGIGPGSFTGLRMGLTVAKAWSLTKPMKFFKFQSGIVSKMKDLKPEHMTEVLDIDRLVPVYTNDHFGEDKPREKK